MRPFTIGIQMTLRDGVLALCFLLATLAAAGPTAAAQDWVYTIRPGDNLWNLSETYLKSMGYWRRLQRLNGVTQPRLMPPGLKLRIPVAWLRVEPTAVEIIAVGGQVSVVSAPGATPQAATTGDLLKSGARISSGPDGSASLRFADGSQLLLENNSELVMDRIGAYGNTGMVDTHMRLEQGRIDTRVIPERGSGTRYRIDTPAATTAVRGTDFRVAMDPDQGLSRAEVLTGRVQVSGQGRRRQVPQGFGTVAGVDRPPAAPVPLLPAPRLAELPDVLERSPPRLDIPPLAGATAYRLQVAPNRDFIRLLFDRVQTGPTLRGPDLPDGHYTLRLRALDSQGLEGRDAYHDFELNARPEPPVVLAPVFDATVRGAAPIFSWSEPEGAAGYRFQLAADPQFQTPLVDRDDLDSEELSLDQALEPGVWYWRLATHAGGETGPFGDPQRFTLKPIPPGPAMEEPALDANTVTFRWTGGLPGEQFQFQLARDSAFLDTVADVVTAEPRYQLPRPRTGVYFLRVRTLSEDGYIGPFGSPQRFILWAESWWPAATVGLAWLLLIL